MDIDLTSVPTSLRPDAMRRIAPRIRDLIRARISPVRCRLRQVTGEVYVGGLSYLSPRGKERPREDIRHTQACRIEINRGGGVSATLTLVPHGHLLNVRCLASYDPAPAPAFDLWTVWRETRFLVRLGLSAYVTWSVWEPVALFERQRFAEEGPGRWLFPVMFVVSWAIAFLIIGWAWRFVGWLISSILESTIVIPDDDPSWLERVLCRLWPGSMWAQRCGERRASSLEDDIGEVVCGHDWTNELKRLIQGEHAE